ncbi:MAG: hypothetical protein ACJARY_003360 [Candidatus Azotimanducaceae bacterium]|jgi:hypothetical protein
MPSVSSQALKVLFAEAYMLKTPYANKYVLLAKHTL